MVYGCGGKRRPRHIRRLCGIGVLHDGKTAASLDGLKPLSAVGICAGQDDPNQGIAEGIRSAFKEKVDGGSGKIDLVVD